MPELPVSTNTAMEQKAADDLFFDESYCTIEHGNLILKTFYFPTFQNRNIEISKIIGVFYAEQNLRQQWGVVKSWGMSFSPCWWACDMRRCWHSGSEKYYNVVVDCGEKTYKGFTVQNIEAFLAALRPQLQPQCVLKPELPF